MLLRATASVAALIVAIAEPRLPGILLVRWLRVAQGRRARADRWLDGVCRCAATPLVGFRGGRIGFPASLILSCLVAPAAAAACYPATPTSFAEFASHVSASFRNGPC